MLAASHLRALFLDDNGMQRVEPGAFDRSPRLEFVWMGGNTVNCSVVPTGPLCIEEHCATAQPERVGVKTGQCESTANNANCAWDGGSCN